MARTTSRRQLIRTAGAATLAASALGVATQQATAAPTSDALVVDVTDHGALGDGVTDDTAAFQTAIDVIADAGAGTLLIPARTYVLAPVTPVVLRADNMVVEADGATFLRPYMNPRPSVMFVANTRGTPGYGAGLRNLTWHGGRFVGNLAEDNAICPFGLHHAQDCLFEGIVSENCHASGSHQFDLGGCADITVRNCTFRGQAWTETAGGECVQLDGSYRGTLSGGSENSGFSGLMSRDITVEDCTFEPFTDDEGTVWPGPTPMGNHFAVEGKYYENIRFANNTVVDPRTAVLFGDHRDTWRGVVHFIAVHGLEVVGNTFTMTQSRQTRVIAVNSIDWGPDATVDPAIGSPKTYWEVPNDCRDVVIADNVITGFTVEPDVAEMGAIVSHGIPGGEVSNLRIRGNLVDGGHQPEASSHGAGIEITHADQVTIERNTVLDRHVGISMVTLSEASVRANRIQNTTGVQFPAAVVGEALTDSSVHPGPTRGYRTSVDLR